MNINASRYIQEMNTSFGSQNGDGIAKTTSKILTFRNGLQRITVKFVTNIIYNSASHGGLNQWHEYDPLEHVR